MSKKTPLLSYQQSQRRIKQLHKHGYKTKIEKKGNIEIILKQKKLMIQNVIFDKKIWTTSKCRIWLKKHGFKPIKRVDVTDNYYRYRIKHPIEFMKGSFITYNFGHGIKSVMGKFKKNY